MPWAGWELSEAMLTLLLFGLIALTWLAMGVAMITVPIWWRDRIGRALRDPLARFLLTQGMILGGLVLLVVVARGDSMERGAFLVIKALILLGAPPWLRERLLDWWGRIPLWAHRLSGMALVALATLLAIDTLQGRP
jgi:hypothetical protein